MIRPARAAKTAVGSRSAIPTWHSAPAAATASTNRSAATCSTEVARRAANRQHQQAGPQHLGARHQVVNRGRHVLEVAGIAGRVCGDDVQLGHLAWASRRRAAAHPDCAGRAEQAMTLLASVTATGDVGDRPAAVDAARPPDGQYPRRAHPPTACTDPKVRPLARMASRTLLIRPHPEMGLPPLPPSLRSR